MYLSPGPHPLNFMYVRMSISKYVCRKRDGGGDKETERDDEKQRRKEKDRGIAYIRKSRYYVYEIWLYEGPSIKIIWEEKWLYKKHD